MEHPAIPNLIVIGAMKCGTTSLHEYLDLHIDIGMSVTKEIDYFAGNNALQELDWYMAHFDGSKAVRGESSQNYTKAHLPFYRDAPRRIHSLVPNMKMIYLVRDPIDRYLSHIVENYIGETEESKKLSMSTNNYVFTSLYHYQLQAYLKYFPLEQILVVDSEDLNCERLLTMNRIFDFLGLTRMDDPKIFEFKSNTNGEEVVPPHIRGRLPYRCVRKLAPRLLQRAVSAPIVRKNLFPESLKVTLDDEERGRLMEFFAPDVAALRELTGQAFSGWKM